MPLTPRTTSRNNKKSPRGGGVAGSTYFRSPTMPLNGHVRNIRSSWESSTKKASWESNASGNRRISGGSAGSSGSGSGGGGAADNNPTKQSWKGVSKIITTADNMSSIAKSTNSRASNNTTNSDAINNAEALTNKSNDLVRKWQMPLPSLPSPKSLSSPSKRRFVPNRDSPTWRSLQKKSKQVQDFSPQEDESNAAQLSSVTDAVGTTTAAGSAFSETYSRAVGTTTASGRAFSETYSHTKVSRRSSEEDDSTIEPSNSMISEISGPSTTSYSGPFTTAYDITPRSTNSSSNNSGQQQQQKPQPRIKQHHKTVVPAALSRTPPKSVSLQIPSEERDKIVQCLSSESSSESSSSSTLNWTVLEKLPEEEELSVGETYVSCGRSKEENPQEENVMDVERSRSAASVGSASVTSFKSKRRSSVCSSSDSTSSSLIYSLGDTIKSSGDTVKSLELSPMVTRENPAFPSRHSVSATRGLLLPSLSIDEETESESDVNDKFFDQGNFDDEAESTAEGGDDDDDQAADLVASTLAECRLLLEMSPPPTPLSNRYKALNNSSRMSDTQRTKPLVQQSWPADAQSQQPQSYSQALPQQPVQSSQQMVEQPPSTENANSANTINTSLDSFTSLSSITKFLTCPACTNEFSEEDQQCVPLHSFACDHIVCRACVFAGSANSKSLITTLVACPECGEHGAFDIHRPVVSRAYLSLVKKMKMDTVLSSSSRRNDKVLSDNGNKTTTQQQPVVRGAVPSQICVPSPTANRVMPRVGSSSNSTSNSTNNSTILEEDEHNGENGSLTSRSTALSNSSSLMSHRHKLPALTIDVGNGNTNTTNEEDTSQSQSKEDEDTNSHGNFSSIEEAISAASSLLARQGQVEPTTPVSRAEYRFRQRKEKLAQSLEKVNRILERSKASRSVATTLQFDVLEEEEENGENNGEDNGVDGMMFPAVKEVDGVSDGEVDEVGKDMDSDHKESREDYLQVEQVKANDDTMEESDDDDVERRAKSVMSRVKSELRFAKEEFLQDVVEENDGNYDGKQERQGTPSVMSSRLKIELRVDTGTSALQDQKVTRDVMMQQLSQEKEGLSKAMVVKKHHSQNDAVSLPAVHLMKVPTTANDQQQQNLFSSRSSKVVDPFMDIFRIDNNSQECDDIGSGTLIEFGNHMIVQSISDDSSLTGDKDDTLFLLADNRPRQPYDAASAASDADSKLSLIRRNLVKDYKIKDYANNIKQRLNSSVDDSEHQHEHQHQHCPQFLPSLNYSTMLESDEFVGLAMPDNNECPSPTGGGRGGGSTTSSPFKSVKSSIKSAASGSANRIRRSRSRKTASTGGGGDGNDSGNTPPKFKQLTQSFDEAFQPNTTSHHVGFGSHDEVAINHLQQQQLQLQQYWKSGFDCHGGIQEEELLPSSEQGGLPLAQLPQLQQQQGLTYDFSVQSCSMSMSSYDEHQYGVDNSMQGGEGQPLAGSLVTHKPNRFHKKILKRFRGIKKGRKSST